MISALRTILLQYPIICGFLMSAYSNGGLFYSRYRLMPMRGLVSWFVVEVIGIDFILLQGSVVVG
jgi:hypothetical protein